MSTMYLTPEDNLESSSETQNSPLVKEAQALLHRLQALLIKGKNPRSEKITEALQNAEALLFQLAHQSQVDLDTRKTLEDISSLLLTARQMSRNKGFADILERISMETQKAVETSRNTEGSSSSREMAGNIMEFSNNWRPLFYLLIVSRDFRKLLLDVIKIISRVAYHTDSFSNDTFPEIPSSDLNYDTPDITDQEWDILEEDIQEILVLLVKKPPFRQGIERIFNLLELFKKSLARNEAMPNAPEEGLQKVVSETEALVASFSGKETMELFKFYLRKFIVKIQENQNAIDYLIELKYLLLSSKSEEKIRSKKFRSESKILAYRGRALMRELRDDDLINFLRAAHEMIENIKNDEFLQILRHHAGIVQSDLSYVDSAGSLKVDTDMLSKLQSVLLPVLTDALKNIPVPRIHSADHNREFWLDNIVLCSHDILPDNIKFHLETDSEVSFKDTKHRPTRTFLVIQLDRLLTELKNVDFYYRKKTFPELGDSGRVSFRVKGRGASLSLTYTIIQDPEENVTKIIEGNASFDIHELDIEFDVGSLKHSFLVPMLTKVFKTQIKQQIEKKVEMNLIGFINRLGEMMTNSIARANRPFLSGIEAARKAVKSSNLDKVYEKRREMLE